MTGRYLIDNSAWVRLPHPHVAEARRRAVANAAADSRLWGSVMLRLEAGCSARSPGAHAALMSDLDGLPQAIVDEAALDRAVDLQSQLARVGHHRVPPTDLVTMAIAERHGLTVLHYDKDYDVIADRTDCAAESEWLAPRGSV